MQSSTTMNSKPSRIEVGEWFFRYRDYTPIPLIVLLLIYGNPTVLSATLGLILIALGELFRIYSVGFIGSISRTRSDSTGSRLITSGPFSYIRNPLYIGNLGITAGFGLYGGVVWIFLLSVALFWVQYFYIVSYEENLLSEKFGEEYDLYRQRVPRWFPDSLPRLEEILWPDTFSPALKSEKRTLTTIFALIFLLAILTGA